MQADLAVGEAVDLEEPVVVGLFLAGGDAGLVEVVAHPSGPGEALVRVERRGLRQQLGEGGGEFVGGDGGVDVTQALADGFGGVDGESSRGHGPGDRRLPRPGSAALGSGIGGAASAARAVEAARVAAKARPVDSSPVGVGPFDTGPSDTGPVGTGRLERLCGLPVGGLRPGEHRAHRDELERFVLARAGDLLDHRLRGEETLLRGQAGVAQLRAGAVGDGRGHPRRVHLEQAAGLRDLGLTGQHRRIRKGRQVSAGATQAGDGIRRLSELLCWVNATKIPKHEHKYERLSRLVDISFEDSFPGLDSLTQRGPGCE
ncbi:hypothetical protein RCH16_002149 [Cryobacterium sp. MP_M5]|nr:MULTISPECIES: hypothetical protein [unclassified Cryobacterium]MBG6058852.1 hypothetical protein [Cryobacterium sp. MP_M3]MEC5177139.1 hypothetical protein [Cryobacterium sp. MP_M5]